MDMLGAIIPIAIVFIVVGIPVLSNTIIKIKKMEAEKHKQYAREEDSEVLEDIYHGIKELRHRVENLETILKDRKGE